VIAGTSIRRDLEPGPSSRLGVAPADRAVRAWRALLVAREAVFRRLDREIGVLGVLCPEDVDVLLPLASAPEQRLRMGELADRVLLSRSGLTRRVDRLVERGLVARRACPSDRRGAWATLTPGGVAELERALPHHRAALGRSLGTHLSEPQLEALIEALDLLADGVPADPGCR